MCELGLRLSKVRLKMDWYNATDPSTIPKLVRQMPFNACECGVCFFCKDHLTSKYGPTQKKPPSSSTHGTPKQSHPVKRVTNDHSKYRERVKQYSVDCGVCVQHCRVQKPTGDERTSKLINRCALGCRHNDCCAYPLCKEHWDQFEHC
mmetsp:Transcript_13316/g.28785  ORF Transcript_13316/g.28785 Transcript_13316/m.28785 type:complete len:148 (+) Transcript_13316:444-887(+)